MEPADLVNKMNELEDDGKPAYYILPAKLALWAVSLVLFFIVGVGAYRMSFELYMGTYMSPVIANVIAAAQALGLICLAVLGYRGRGRRKR